jgi:NADH-quinone oxidoreductase subunit G
LIEPSEEMAGEQLFNTTQDVPPAFKQRQGEWLIGPLYHIFGSEELSLYTPGIAELAPTPYLGVSPEDAGQLQVQDGEEIVLELDESQGRSHHKISLRLPAKIIPGLPRGTAGLPVGLPGFPWAGLPEWGRLAALKEKGILS